MLRGRLFTAQFLAVAMFSLFLPGVSRSDSLQNDDYDASSVLSPVSASSATRSSMISSSAFDLSEDPTTSTSNEEASATHSGELSQVAFPVGIAESTSGGRTEIDWATVPVSSIDSDRDWVPITVELTRADTTDSQPESVSLLLAGLGFLIVRRVLPRGRNRVRRVPRFYPVH
jgi:hypothetical protein